MRSWRTRGLLAFLAWALIALGPPPRAADNAARGGIDGFDNGTLLGGDGTGQARISLFATELALVKQARDTAGNVLPANAEVSPAAEIWFVLYVDNPTSAPATDVQLADALDESAFTYIPGSLAGALLPSGVDDAALWAASWSALTDPTGAPDDVASATNTGGAPAADRITVGAVPGQANLNVDIPASSRFAVRFRVRVN